MTNAAPLACRDKAWSILQSGEESGDGSDWEADEEMRGPVRPSDTEGTGSVWVKGTLGQWFKTIVERSSLRRVSREWLLWVQMSDRME